MQHPWMNGLHLSGRLYSKVLHKIQSARETGQTTRLTLIQQKVCLATVGRLQVCPPMLYHVGLLAETEDRQRIFEHGPVQYDQTRGFDDEKTLRIPLPSVHNALEDILAFEETLPTKYLIGVRDCRHHVLDLLGYLYD